MGILTKIWNFFASPIVLKKEKPEELIVPVKFSSGRLKLNKKIFVPQNWYLVFCVGDKPCDVLSAGQYRANENDIPIVVRASKSLRPNGRGKVKPWIKCSAYYVRASKISNFKFRAGLPFVVKNENMGKVKGKVEGSFSCQVKDPNQLLKCVFADVFTINRKAGMQFVCNLLVDEINRTIEENQSYFEKMLLQPAFFNEILNQKIVSNMSTLGVEVSDIQVVSMSLPKKTQKIVNDFLVEAGASYVADYVVGQQGQLIEEMDETKVDQLIEQAPEEEQPVTEDGLRSILEQTVAQKPRLFDQTSNEDTFFTHSQKETSEVLDQRSNNLQDLGRRENLEDFSSRRSVSPLDLDQRSRDRDVDFASNNRDRGVNMQDFASNNRDRGVGLDPFDRRRNEDAVIQDRHPFGRDRSVEMDDVATRREGLDFGRNRDLGVDNAFDRRKGLDMSSDSMRRGGLDFEDRGRKIQDRASNLDFGTRRNSGVEERRQRAIYPEQEQPTKDIFAGTSDKKQCKFCDRLIGVEYQFCPFCGFKQGK